MSRSRSRSRAQQREQERAFVGFAEVAEWDALRLLASTHRHTLSGEGRGEKAEHGLLAATALWLGQFFVNT